MVEICWSIAQLQYNMKNEPAKSSLSAKSFLNIVCIKAIVSPRANKGRILITLQMYFRTCQSWASQTRSSNKHSRTMDSYKIRSILYLYIALHSYSCDIILYWWPHYTILVILLHLLHNLNKFLTFISVCAEGFTTFLSHIL